MRLRILIAVAQATLGATLRTLLAAENNIDVVGEAGDMAEVIRVATATHPTLILLDIGLPGLGRLDGVQRLRRILPAVQILLLTGGEDPGPRLRDLLAPTGPRPATPADLTPREANVLRLIALGYTNRQAADELGLSVRTVESHREKIIAKLGLHRRADLVQYANERGLVAAPR
jgi:two-component system response regulator NreC